MENAFSTDFSGVRVHLGSKAAELSREIQARAFTYGNDIYFNGGVYAQHSQRGQRLLAHELTHVIQQKSGIQAVQCEREFDAAEPETIKCLTKVMRS